MNSTQNLAVAADDEVLKTKNLEELDAALTESRIYEESRLEEATMRRLRWEVADERRRDELAQLNARFAEEVRDAVEAGPYEDLREVVWLAVARYTAEAAGIEERGPRGALSASSELLCPLCKNYHGSAEWHGLCSRCRALPLSKKVGCGPSLFKAVGRAIRQRSRRSLPAPPSPDQWRSGRRLLEERLARHAKTGKNVKGDGACQFRAVADQLFDDERHHPLVRRRALDHLKAHPPDVFDCEVYVSDSTEPTGVRVATVGTDFGEYLSAMSSNAAWGDATTLQACADAFQVRVLLVTTNDANFELLIEPDGVAALKEIWIGFHSEMHYISVVA